MVEDDKQILHEIDKKLSSICAEIKHLVEETKENKDDIKDIKNKLDTQVEKLYNKLDEKFVGQNAFCAARVTDHEKEFKKRPTINTLLSVIFIIITLITGSYTYTTIVKDKVDNNLISITRNTKDCEKALERIDINHNGSTVTYGIDQDN